MKAMFVLVAAVSLTGCKMAPTKEGALVKDADQSMVASCHYLGEVSGWSGWGGLGAGTGMANAQTEARDKAGKMGATHIIWNSVQGGYTPSASGKAYACRS